MLRIFQSPLFRDAALGEFARARGHWRGTIDLGGTAVSLVLTGGRSQPEPETLQLARVIGPSFPSWRPGMAEALFEHYQPYVEGFATGDLPAPSTSFPRVGTPGEVWPHVTFDFVSVTPLSRVLTVEFGLTVAWDEEHTLGARFQEGKFLELCGSVVPP